MIEVSNVVVRDAIFRFASTLQNLSLSDITIRNEDIKFQEGDFESISLENVSNRGDSNHVVHVQSGATMDGFRIDGMQQNGLFGSDDATTLRIDGTVNNLTTTGFEIESAGTVFDFQGSVNGTVAGPFEYDSGDVSTVYGSMSDAKLSEGMPPLDVRTLANKERSRAYHDGSGTDNTEGPAFNSGSGWTSLVDGTTIS
jgi:hypothetical protein